MAGFGTKASYLIDSDRRYYDHFYFSGFTFYRQVGKKTTIDFGFIGIHFKFNRVSMSFYFQSSPEWIAFYIFAFIASHAVGQGAVIWVFISEIFPNRIRAKGQSFRAGVHWVFAYYSSFPFIAICKRHGLFSHFAVMMVLQLVFSIFIMPETKENPRRN